MIVNISEAKTNLSKLVNMAYHGEKVVIAKNNLPLVELVSQAKKNWANLLLCGSDFSPTSYVD